MTCVDGVTADQRFYQMLIQRIAASHHLSKVSAHRSAWTLAHGAIPDGLYVCHHCDNRRCCNPGHLFLGTHTDNMRDMVMKGRGRRPNAAGIRGEANAMARLTEHDVINIRTRYRRGLGSQMAAEYGVSSATISMIVTGKTWAHAPGVRRIACASAKRSTRLQTSKHQPRPDSVAA